MGPLLLKLLGGVYLALGILAAVALSSPSFRESSLADLVRFPRYAKIVWTLAFSSSAAGFGLALLLSLAVAPWLGWATAAAYAGSTLHEVAVDYGRNAFAVLRRGFFVMAAIHTAVAGLVTFLWLRFA